MAAKEKEIATNTKSIEVKTERLGQLSVDIVELKEDLDDTAKSLKEDKAFLKNLGSQCETKKAEWEERSKMRQQELLALADTIKMLNDDDAPLRRSIQVQPRRPSFTTCCGFCRRRRKCRIHS